VGVGEQKIPEHGKKETTFQAKQRQTNRHRQRRSKASRQKNKDEANPR